MSTSVVAEALAATVIAPAAWGGVPTMRALPACSTRTGRRSFGSAHALEPVLRTLTVAIRWPAAPSQAVISALRSAAAQASTEPGTDVGVASGPTAAVLWVGPGPFRPPAPGTGGRRGRDRGRVDRLHGLLGESPDPALEPRLIGIDLVVRQVGHRGAP